VKEHATYFVRWNTSATFKFHRVLPTTALGQLALSPARFTWYVYCTVFSSSSSSNQIFPLGAHNSSVLLRANSAPCIKILYHQLVQYQVPAAARERVLWPNHLSEPFYHVNFCTIEGWRRIVDVIEASPAMGKGGKRRRESEENES
jgi:hypothetical protein